MKNFIIFTGVLGLLAGFGSLFPAVARQLLPSEKPGMLLTIFGLTAMFLGLVLLVSSRDLKQRGIYVIWVGVFKIVAFAVMAFYSISLHQGISSMAGGILDLIFGTVFLVGLPKHLGTSLPKLALDN
jgi:hypothetical protein